MNRSLCIIFSILLSSLFLLIFCSCSHCNNSTDNFVIEPDFSNISSKTDLPPVAPELLTYEDGTGIIYIGMHRDDVIEQFDEWNLNYELSYSPEISDFSSITVNYGSYCYRFDREGHLESVQFDVTPSGLAYGDTVEKMIEIYGTDYLYSTHSTGSGSILCYYTYSFSASTVFTVEAYGEGNDGTVMRRAVGQKD